MSGSTLPFFPDILTHDEDTSKAPTKFVKLNVGGSLFYTTLGTLTNRHDSLLRAMFSRRMDVRTDSDGWVLIDRSGKHFGKILNYLRDGIIPLPDNKIDLKDLLEEAKYYCLPELSMEIEEELKKHGDDLVPRCRVTLVTSQKEERMLIAKTEKPVIKLICSRYNNKYSYTSQSIDNILKNVELFDKLSLRFNGRILFVKDVHGQTSDEICCWSFYGNGKKHTEVCCTSIVYATEKKQTKVEFPEARIYEDTLNILLFEGRAELAALDHELLLKTSKKSDERRKPARSDQEHTASEDEGSNTSRRHQGDGF